MNSLPIVPLVCAALATAAVERPAFATTLALQAGDSDTTRPPMPSMLNLPADSTMTVRAPAGRLPQLYFRTLIGIVFDDTTSGTTIRSVLRQHEATIIGGAPYVGTLGAYIVRVPDPGTPFDALESLLSRVASASGVDYAFGVTYRGFVRVR